MKHISRRDMLKMIGISLAGTTLAACTPKATVEPTKAATQVEATKPPEASATAPKGAPVKVIFVESWFGVPQYADVIDPVTKAISEKMQSEGLNIELQSMILDDHTTKYPVLFSSGADFTCAFDAPWYKMNTLRDQGALVQLEDMMPKYAPKLVEAITQKVLDFNYLPDHIYGIPVGFFYNGDTGAVIREDLRQKYNVPAPDGAVGYRSLEPYLEAIAKNETGLVPFANTPGYPPSSANVVAKRSWAPGATEALGIIVPEVFKDTKLTNIEDIPAYMDSWTMIREWWEKGYVNKTDLAFSAASQTVPTDFFFPGKCAAFQENEPEQKSSEIFTKPLAKSIPGATCTGWSMSGVRQGKVRGIGALKQWNFVVFNINAKSENQIAGLQYFNWCTTAQENADLWLLGIEGKNWKKEDNMRFSEVEGTDATRNYRRQWYVSGVPGKFSRLPKDLTKEAEEAVKFYSTESNWDFNPYEKFDPDLKALEAEVATLTAVKDEAAHGLVSGQLPTEEALAKYKKTLDDAGRQQFKEKLQKQIDDFIAKNK